MNNKMVGRKVMAHAEKAQALQEDQYGSRKNHNAINCCLNKRITADISYQRRQALFIASNDAKGCYDRIHYVVGTLALMRFGVPWKVCAVLFEVLKRAKHSIQTAYGTAPDMYG